MTLQLRNIPGKLVQAGKDAVITITEQVFNLRYCVRGTSNMKKSSITSLVIFRWRLMESSCEVLLWGFPTLTPPDPSRRELLQQVHQCSLPGKIAGFPLHRAQDSLVQLICIYVFDHLIYKGNGHGIFKNLWNSTMRLYNIAANLIRVIGNFYRPCHQCSLPQS